MSWAVLGPLQRGEDGWVGREGCGTEMGMSDVHEPAWGLPDTELSIELHPCFGFFNHNV